MNPVAYPPRSKRLLEQVREVLRYKHSSLKTEQAYLCWVRFSIRWCGRDGQMRHPRDMGAVEVTQFLTLLANERRVSVSTHNQALSALLFLYREVHSDVITTMIYTHVLKVAAGGIASPLDALAASPLP